MIFEGSISTSGNLFCDFPMMILGCLSTGGGRGVGGWGKLFTSATSLFMWFVLGIHIPLCKVIMISGSPHPHVGSRKDFRGGAAEIGTRKARTQQILFIIINFTRREKSVTKPTELVAALASSLC